MYGLKYNESMSTKIHEHYTFIDENYCTVISARCGLPIELVVYHNTKEFMIYHMYEADKKIMNNIFECIDNNLDFLDASDYEPIETTLGTQWFIEYIMKEHGYNENN